MMKSPAKQRMSRRHFLETLGATSAVCALGRMAGGATAPPVTGQVPYPALHEARFYSRLPDQGVRCDLCPRSCTVPDGDRGYCGVRENRGGNYYTLVYGLVSARHVDPIEKKPFYHVYPGSKAFSIAAVGCNLHCKFCQNFDISQARPEEVQSPFLSPDRIAGLAAAQGCKLLAFTYNEPTVMFEFMADCARAAGERGIESLIISNGFIQDAPQKQLFPLVKAIKIDLKAYTESFYSRICDGSLRPVLDTLKRLSRSGVWYEIVNLLIPTLNDNRDEVKRMAAWIVRELGPDVPLHFTRFTPLYRLRNLPPTPSETLLAAREIALSEGCHFVYTGNQPGLKGEDTFCSSCRKPAIRRYGFSILQNNLTRGKCNFCGTAIPGVWG